MGGGGGVGYSLFTHPDCYLLTHFSLQTYRAAEQRTEIQLRCHFLIGFYYMPVAFLSICQELLTQMDYHLDMTDAIFLPLTRAWRGEGYDEAVVEAES